MPCLPLSCPMACAPKLILLANGEVCPLLVADASASSTALVFAFAFSSMPLDILSPRDRLRLPNGVVRLWGEPDRPSVPMERRRCWLAWAAAVVIEAGYALVAPAVKEGRAERAFENMSAKEPRRRLGPGDVGDVPPSLMFAVAADMRGLIRYVC